jgi:peptidoglycan/LPS O-acetylase OafA/YrhL
LALKGRDDQNGRDHRSATAEIVGTIARPRSRPAVSAAEDPGDLVRERIGTSVLRRAPKKAALAALALAVAVVVLIVAPLLLDAPNPLAPLVAVVVAVGSGGALLGGESGRLVASAVSWTGLLASALWLFLASNGFGKGTPWWDDVIEAAILAAAFLVAAILLRGDRGDRQRAGDVGGRTP